MNFRKMTLLAMSVGIALGAMGMPGRMALKKAQSVVAELLKDDLAAMKDEKIKPGEVAAKAVKLAGEAKNEAVRYLFYRGGGVLVRP